MPRLLRTIRARVVTIGLLVGLAPAALVMQDAIHDYTQRERILRHADANRVRSALMLGAVEISFERSLTQVALALDAPVGSDIRRLIETQRQKSEAEFGRVAELAAGLPQRDSIRRFRAETEALRQRLTALRSEADAQMARPIGEREAARRETLPRDLMALVIGFQQARVLLRAEPASSSTTLTHLETIQDRAWEAREYAGRERTRFAAALARGGEPIPAELRTQMAFDWNRAVNAIEVSARYANLPGVPEALRRQATTARRDLVEGHAVLRGSLLAASAEATPRYPVDFAEYFRRSGDVLAAVEAVVREASAATEAYWQDAASAKQRDLLIDFGVLVLCILAAGALLRLLGRGALDPFDDVRVAMERLAKGESVERIPHLGRPDEAGRMAAALAVFAEGIRERERLAAQAGEAERSRAEALRQARRDLADSFEARLGGIAQALGEQAAGLSGAAGSLGRQARTNRARSEDALGVADGAAGSVERVAASAAALRDSIDEITRQVGEAAGVSARAGQEAQASDATVAQLTEGARRIGDVVRLISDIASRTNLLALNATIEAARAGEAGKGFAVVATEVKNLAGQTAKATDEISAQIAEMQASTERTVTAIRDIASVIGSLERIAGAISAAVAEQASATRDIAQGATDAAEATRALRESAASVAEGAERNSAVSQEVERAAAAIAKQDEALRAEVAAVLSSLRAA